MAQLGELLPRSVRDTGSIVTLCAIREEFAHSPCEILGFLRVLWLPNDMQVGRLISRCFPLCVDKL